MEKKTEDSITIETLLRAPINLVWNAWTDPSFIINWFGSDPNGRGINASLDVRSGGAFSVTFQDGNGTQHTCKGIYAEVEQLSKLTFSWEWESEPGVESCVTVLLSSEGSNTLMHFKHSNLGTASAHDYLYGWKSTFKKLQKLLKKVAQ